MSNYTVGGSVTVTFGSNPGVAVTITTAQLAQTPLVFTLPPGTTVPAITVGELTAYLQNFGIPAITLPTGVSATSFTLTGLTVSSAGYLNLSGSLALGGTSGWTIIPGLTVNSITINVAYSTKPYITGITPSSAASGASVTIAGLDFTSTSAGSAPTVTFPSVTTAAIPSTITATSLIVAVPTGATSGNVTVTNTDGTSNGAEFSVTS